MRLMLRQSSAAAATSRAGELFLLKYPDTAQGPNHKIAAAHFYRRVRDLPLP
jgi:hypothetical protein